VSDAKGPEARATPSAPSQGTPAPLVLTAFAAFCVLATVGECVLLLFQSVLESAPYARIVPILGWVPGMPYMFALYWALQLRWRPSATARRAALVMLLLGATFGLIEFVISLRRENYGNPWLTVSAWRPLVTVALPLLWSALLMSPAVVKFCRVGSQAPAPAAAP
jgi:hypothetical protein